MDLAKKRPKVYDYKLIFIASKPGKTKNVKGFKKDGGINVNQFIVETNNVADDMKAAYTKHLQEVFVNAGMKNKYLKDPKFKKEVEELIISHQKEEEIRRTNWKEEDDEEEKKRSYSVVLKPNIKDDILKADTQIESIEEKPEEEEDNNIKSVTKVIGSGTAPPPPPPPPGGMGKMLPPPPPPPAPVPNAGVMPELKKNTPNRNPATDKRNSAQPMTLLEQLQSVKLKPATGKKTAPLPEEDTLQAKLQKLLNERREELNKACSSSDSNASSDNDSSDFD